MENNKIDYNKLRRKITADNKGVTVQEYQKICLKNAANKRGLTVKEYQKQLRENTAIKMGFIDFNEYIIYRKFIKKHGILNLSVENFRELRKLLKDYKNSTFYSREMNSKEIKEKIVKDYLKNI